MKRRSLLKGMALLPALPLLGHAPLSLAEAVASNVTPLNKPHSDWRDLLTPEAYAVLFEEDTEAPGSSPLNQEKRDGTYLCAACYLPLFASQDKYESGTGWPSFTQPIAGHMGTKRDFKLFFPRTEYHCARCGGHQGHVFDDGPKPRGERWCNNGVALRFIPQGEALPELRS
ncbi:MAG: peptide-methionine (R)-S-oxide reductase [Pseudomonas sp.]|uniref:peptide-methionine (R)-S-oxide reductase MsrB n=1 Tax=Pseudomonas sp. FEMGT703P TaxID=2080764 RepID=UPI000CAB22CB|nr:peptide-methionine (R)-S-oxide reductase MsrB [Pseudomonas sp. FEMGT703P]PJE43217.1 MAG: peptide-methionine (R)-S-oxide reductase [Pseudomonas sp.] [Pseudomonas sp. FEMGT703P]